MNWQVVIETPAQSDIDEAFIWYEEQSNGLGFRFIAALDDVIEAIIRNPYFASFFNTEHQKRFPIGFSV